MNKQIFVLNGTAGAGKDTFADLLNEHIPTKHISSITPVKQAAQALGWNGEKTDSARKFLCELKKFVNSQGDYIWNYLDKQVEEFKADDKTRVLLIDIREPDEIKKAVERYSAKTILITRQEPARIGNANVEIITSRSRASGIVNDADLNVDYYNYDYRIPNDGTFQGFKAIVSKFAEKIKPLELQGKVIAVDFDNTIAKTRYPEIVEPIPETINFLRKAKENGVTIILWTCREGTVLDDAVEWCKRNNVPIDLVNENVPSRSEYWGNDSRKIGADLYIDDKSFSLWHDRRNENDLITQLLEENNK